MTEIPNGSVAYLNVDITDLAWPTLSNTPDGILSAIAGELIFDGLTIANKSVGLSGLAFALTGEFSATLQILNQSGQELDDADLTAQFLDAANSLSAYSLRINSSAVTQVVGAPTGVNSGTGAQGNVTITAAGAAAQQSSSSTPAVHQCGDPTWSGWSDPIQYIKCLTQGGLTTIGILAIGLLIGVVLIVATQNRPRVSV